MYFKFMLSGHSFPVSLVIKTGRGHLLLPPDLRFASGLPAYHPVKSSESKAAPT
ncbi:hypothetical protein BACCAP_03756 [Pseudoflavonifractor capillosus ATCC 29799]|uniref:Uncharacterized protein n=1 Tax=Pseudoflavonifractor capillosus ATCC 29799 TaxID=411467 RepID=A6NZV1_9FIRM|nr:hypothetical protein BACCAP_03756 [Pseudoflavonifractor capillosus ATCC 29799]